MKTLIAVFGFIALALGVAGGYERQVQLIRQPFIIDGPIDGNLPEEVLATIARARDRLHPLKNDTEHWLVFRTNNIYLPVRTGLVPVVDRRTGRKVIDPRTGEQMLVETSAAASIDNMGESAGVFVVPPHHDFWIVLPQPLPSPAPDITLGYDCTQPQIDGSSVTVNKNPLTLTIKYPYKYHQGNIVTQYCEALF